VRHGLFWVTRIVCLSIAALHSYAADKVTVTINHQTISAWRTADLEGAKKEAAAAHKPIAWIASSPEYLDGTGKISMNGSRGATLHAFYALRDRTVLVFEDGFAENHKVIAMVDVAIHSHNGEPDHHPILPVVVFLDPDVTQVLAKADFESDFVKRAHVLADALAQADAKMNALPNEPRK